MLTSRNGLQEVMMSDYWTDFNNQVEATVTTPPEQDFGQDLCNWL